MDDTLYPMSMGLNIACRKNIEGKAEIFFLAREKKEEIFFN